MVQKASQESIIIIKKGRDIMCLFISLLPATIWLTIGYFVLFSSTKTEGNIQKFGRILAIWIFVIASFFPIMGAYITLSGICPIEKMMEQMM